VDGEGGESGCPGLLGKVGVPVFRVVGLRLGGGKKWVSQSSCLEELEVDPSLEACAAELPGDVWRGSRAAGRTVKTEVTQFV
jgi:hypothetical protein